MAITSGRITVTSTPVQIIPEPTNIGGYTIIIQNLSNSKSVYLDGANVEPGTGFELKKGETTPAIPIAPDESLYGVTDPEESVEICYLITKR